MICDISINVRFDEIHVDTINGSSAASLKYEDSYGRFNFGANGVVCVRSHLLCTYLRVISPEFQSDLNKLTGKESSWHKIFEDFLFCLLLENGKLSEYVIKLAELKYELGIQKGKSKIQESIKELLCIKS